MLPRLRTTPVRWRCGGEAFDQPLAVMVIGNTRLYGMLVKVTPRAVANDGLLDVCAFCPARRGDATRLSARLLVRRHEGDARALLARTTQLSIETPGIPVQLDGDYVAETPVEIAIEPGALEVSLPPGPLPAIFGDARD